MGLGFQVLGGGLITLFLELWLGKEYSKSTKIR